jgi:hypothetical protein
VSAIVGVHGIAQQQLGRKQLLRAWGPALEDGVELAAGRSVTGLTFDLAFYGHLFLRPAVAGRMGSSDGAALADLDPVEVEELLGAVGEVLTEEEIAAAKRLPPTMGYMRVPRPLQVMLRGLDAKFGAAAGVLYVGTLRQVRRYLREEGLRRAADEIVARAVGPGCRVLVGHSLGSVLALEFVRRSPEHRVDLLLTVGSPLGLRMVQSRLAEPHFGATTGRGIPENVAAWVNVRDVRDPIACAGNLCRWWRGIEDRCVDNGGDAHNVARYLGKEQTGSAILRALPQAGMRLE